MTSYPHPTTRRSTRNKPIILAAWGDAMIAWLAMTHKLSSYDDGSIYTARRETDEHMQRFRRYADALRRMT